MTRAPETKAELIEVSKQDVIEAIAAAIDWAEMQHQRRPTFAAGAVLDALSSLDLALVPAEPTFAMSTKAGQAIWATASENNHNLAAKAVEAAISAGNLLTKE